MKPRKTGNWRRRCWFGIATILLAGLVVAANMPVWAAPANVPHNQTVPQPTATSKPSELPTATPSRDDSDDDDDSDDGSSSQPDETATPEPEPDPVEPGADDAVDDNASGVEILGEVVVVRLNVRDGPGTDFEIIGALESGDVVTLLGRSVDGVWWAVCCIGEEGRPGWVGAQFIRPNVGRTDANNALPVFASLDELLAASASDPSASDEAPEIDATGTAATTLLLEIAQSPQYVLQGEQVALTLMVTNTGEEDAQTVLLSDQLPGGLTFVSAEIDAGGSVSQESGDSGALIVVAKWPRLEAGTSAAALLTLEIADDHPDGSVIDNLAAVSADNAEGATSGVSIGTVPTLLPDF